MRTRGPVAIRASDPPGVVRRRRTVQRATPEPPRAVERTDRWARISGMTDATTPASPTMPSQPGSAPATDTGTGTDAGGTGPGSWPSPISAADAVRGRRALSSCAWAGEAIWWSEGRPDEGGRATVCARAADGSGDVLDLLPAPWNARTRVDEYGGVSFLPVARTDGSGEYDLVFTNFSDQILYRLVQGSEPVPLVPAPDRPAGLRWADLTLDPRRGTLIAIREVHEGDGTFGTVRRSVVAIPLDGSAAADPRADRGGGQRRGFLRLSRTRPDGRPPRLPLLEPPRHALGRHRTAPGAPGRRRRRTRGHRPGRWAGRQRAGARVPPAGRRRRIAVGGQRRGGLVAAGDPGPRDRRAPVPGGG